MIYGPFKPDSFSSPSTLYLNPQIYLAANIKKYENVVHRKYRTLYLELTISTKIQNDGKKNKLKVETQK